MISGPTFLLYCLSAFYARSAVAFDPRIHSKHVAHCPGVNRKDERDVTLDLRACFTSLFCSHGLTMCWYVRADYVDTNPGASETIIMLHGWPGLWSNWGKQIEMLKVRFECLRTTEPYRPRPPFETPSTSRSALLVNTHVLHSEQTGHPPPLDSRPTWIWRIDTPGGC